MHAIFLFHYHENLMSATLLVQVLVQVLSTGVEVQTCSCSRVTKSVQVRKHLFRVFTISLWTFGFPSPTELGRCCHPHCGEGAGAERIWVICSRLLRNFGRRELNPDFHVLGWLPKLVLFMFLVSAQYFGDTQAVVSTVDIFYSRTRFFYLAHLETGW